MSSNQDTPTAAAEAKFYVYVHVKADDGEPFYVGKGSGKRAWNTANRSAWWKRIVAKHGLVVKIQKHFQDESEAFASEIETIAILRDLGYELCNLTDGGEGCSGRSLNERARQAVAEGQRRRWSNPRARQAMIEQNRQRMSSPEAREVLAKHSAQYWSNPAAREAQADRQRQRMASAEARDMVSIRMSGENSPVAKLTDEDCRAIFRLQANGVLQKHIAIQTGVSPRHIRRILSGERRRNIYLEFHPD